MMGDDRIVVDMSPVVHAINALGGRIDRMNASILAVNEAILAMQTKICRQLDQLENTVVNVEVEKVNAKEESSQELCKQVSEELGAVEEKYDKETTKMKDEYSVAIERVVDHLKEDIKVNVDPLHRVLGHFHTVNDDLVNPTMSIGENLLEACTSNYRYRLSALKDARKGVSQNFGSFLKSREDLVHQIESMESGVLPSRSMILYVPFWFIGIQNETGEEETIVLPVQERFRPSGVPPATRESPYTEHLQPPPKLAFEELTKDIITQNTKLKAMANTRGIDVDCERSRQIFERMCQEGTIHRSFVEAFCRFKEVLIS